MNLRLDPYRSGALPTADVYQHLSDDDPLPPRPTGQISVSLARWRRQAKALELWLTDNERPGNRVAVRVNGDDDLAELAPDLPRLATVIIEFPVFTDGRGYSLAQRLRLHYDYGGELRASGDVLRDQVAFMARCGFDVLELAADQNTDLSAINSALQEISIDYQRGGYAGSAAPIAATG